MAKESKCVVSHCGCRAHSKGYCRKHYGQIWRKGKIAAPEPEEDVLADVADARDDTDRMRALERELRRAEMMYQNVVSFEGRLKWRREIEEIKKEMVRLGMTVPERLPAAIMPRSLDVFAPSAAY